MRYALSNYQWRLPDDDMEREAQRLTREVLDTLSKGGDNLAILASVRRALLEKPESKRHHSGETAIFDTPSQSQPRPLGEGRA